MFMLKPIGLMAFLLALTACTPHAYHYYIADNNMQAVKQMQAQGYDINALDYWGTPLAMAARYNNLPMAEYLIDNGADLNYGNVDGYESKSPLHAAAAHNAVDVARLLLANGALTDVRNNENQTPLEVAEAKGNQAMIDLLREEDVQETDWQNTLKADTVEAYDLFLATWPQSAYHDDAIWMRDQAIVQAKAAQKAQLKKQELAALEATLPPSVRRDKLMVQLSQHLKQRDYEQALPIFPKLEQLPVEVDPSLKFFYGEALLETGNPDEALRKFYEYVSEQGSGAKHYARALTLINEAESQL